MDYLSKPGRSKYCSVFAAMAAWVDQDHSARISRWVALFALMLVLSGCALSNRQPDLNRLYETERTEIPRPPVVLIPGLMGTRLVSEQHGEIWVGSLIDLMLSNYRHAALEFDPNSLEALPGDVTQGGLTSKFAGRDFYDSIVRTLEQAGGYRQAKPGEPIDVGEAVYYVLAYDWRLDNLRSVERLEALFEQIRIDHGDPELQIDIVAHSMGGMIARYWMRYGLSDVLEDNKFPVSYHGEGRVRRIVLLGTPNLGSVESLKALLLGRRIGLRTIPPEVLMTFPSFYQLLPHPLNDWLLDMDGQPMDIDPFNLSTWKRFEWSIFDPSVRRRIRADAPDAETAQARVEQLERYFHKQLERGRRFLWSLTVALDREPWQLVVFGGDCHLTPARLLVEHRDESYVVHLRPEDIRRPRPGVDYQRLMLEPGDGVVTKASLLARESLDPRVPRHRWSHFPLHYPLFLCERHSQLSTNVTFQNNLLNFLLNQDES